MDIIFVTGNENKFSEASLILSSFGIEIKHSGKEKKIEIQSDNLRDIVRYSLSHIKPMKDRCFIVEDGGLFINTLAGFPGPYSAQAFNTIGLEGILKLIEDKKDRRACFRSVVGILLPNGDIRIFKGEVNGTISRVIIGKYAFAYNPIFIPKGRKRTFAQMSMGKKSAISDRGLAFSKLGSYLKNIP